MNPEHRRLCLTRFLLVSCCLVLPARAGLSIGDAPKPAPAELSADYTKNVRPLMVKYCLTCHSAKEKKGKVNLERFTSVDLVRKEPQLWQTVAELLEQSEMPPKDKPQPKPEERKRIVTWVRKAVETETQAPAEDNPSPPTPLPQGERSE